MRDELGIVLKNRDPNGGCSPTDRIPLGTSPTILMQKLLHSGRRWKLISKALSMFEVENRSGELILAVSDEHYGEALYDFVQALLKITDVSYLSRERVQSTFMEDFYAVLHEKVETTRMEFGWHDRDHDPHEIIG